MKQVIIRNLSRPLSADLRVDYCRSFFCRLRGFSFRREVTRDGGLLLVHGSESRVDSVIHMLGVFFDLGVVWLSSDQEVVDLCLARRWRPFYLPRQAARYILEISPGRLDEFRVGDRLQIEDGT